jgi:hypothetical protein
MKRRFKQDDDDAGLDSLLDTMTNVVGILVLVLIVTQMGVKEKMADITANSTVTAEEVETAQADLKKQQRELEKLRKQSKSVSSIDIQAERQRLERMNKQLASGQRDVEQQNKQINEFTLRIEGDRKRAAELEKEIKDTEAKRKELDAELKTSLVERTKLTALLEELPRNPTPKISAIRIPNPRPAPKGAQEATFICAGDKLFPLRLVHHRKYAEQAAKQLIADQNLTGAAATGIDPVKFTELFTQLESPPDEGFFTAEYYVAGNRWPRIRFHPKMEFGVEAKALSRPATKIRKLIGALDPKKFFCRFYVLADSYNIYVAARRTVTRQKLLAGWEPQPDTWTLSTSVPGVELGPPRPKPPPPKNPPPPRKPSNVID